MGSDQADATAQDPDEAGQGMTEGQQREQPLRPAPWPWPLDSGENRLLVITFIGGVGGFVVGAGFVGGAIALARLVQRAKLPWWAWLLLGGFTVLLSIGVGLVIHVGRRQWMRNDPNLTVGKMLIEQTPWIVLLVFLLLMWIGLAAGFK